jgi:hypothetical protein
MKLKLFYWLIIAGTILLQGCSDDLISNDDDIDTMQPSAGTDPGDRPTPPPNEPVITTDERFIYDVTGQPVLLRGIELAYGDDPVTRINGIGAINDVGSNVVRLLLTPQTTETELEAALSTVLDNGMLAILSLTDDGSEITCTDDSTGLLAAIDDLWLGEWIEVLVQDRFQSIMMINFADGWGPLNIFYKDSLGYIEYIDVYKALIRRFRNAGFKVPIVIDAPHCGQDFNAFLNGRGRQLLVADSEQNIIFGLNPDGDHWDTSDNILGAFTGLDNEGVPVILTGFAGSGVGEFPVDHLDIMDKSKGDLALKFDLPWVSDADGVGYTMALETPLMLRKASVSMSVHVDTRYLQYEGLTPGSIQLVPTGPLSVGIYLIDSNSDRLRLGATEARDLRRDFWNPVSFDVPAEDEIDPANLMDGSTTFDVFSVTHIGIEILANGKPVNVVGGIRIDDVEVFPGVPIMYQANFDTNSEDWIVNWGAAPVPNNGIVEIVPDGADNFTFGIHSWSGTGTGIAGIDATKVLKVKIRMFIPSEYQATWGQGFMQYPAWHAVSLNASTILYDQWFDLEYTIGDPSLLTAFEGFGLQIGGWAAMARTNPILIDSVQIEDLNARPTRIVTATQYLGTFTNGTEAWDDAGWDPDRAVVSAVGGELLVTFPAGDTGGALNKMDIYSIPEISFSGALTVKMSVFMPAEYDGSPFWITFYFQDAFWNLHPNLELTPLGAGLTPVDFNLGGWTDFVFEVADSDYPVDFARTLPARMFAIQYNNPITGSTLRFDNIEIIGNSVVLDLTPAEVFSFDTLADVDAVTYDGVIASGGFNADEPASAKMPDFQLVPFGWTASTWIGAAAGREGLNISNTVDSSTDLTTRGDEIVNGIQTAIPSF